MQKIELKEEDYRRIKDLALANFRRNGINSREDNFSAKCFTEAVMVILKNKGVDLELVKELEYDNEPEGY